MINDFDEIHDVQRNSSNNNYKSNFRISRKPSSKPIKKVLLETSIHDAVPKGKAKRTISRKKPGHLDALASLNDAKETFSTPKQTFFVNPNYSFFNSPSVFECFNIEISNVENEVKTVSDSIGEDISPLYKHFSFDETSDEIQNLNGFLAESNNNDLPIINEQVLDFQKKSLDSIQNLYTNMISYRENQRTNEIINKNIKQDKELKFSIENLTKEVLSLQNKISDLETKISKVKNEINKETKNEGLNHVQPLNQVLDISSKKESFNETYTVCDNETLLIDEITQKVYLPYTFDELMIKMFNNINYLSIEEVIEKEYTLPLYLFKNPIRSRFKEGYRLMRLKEHAPISEALNLATKVMFNSKLNPAVIRACTNIGELNLYLIALSNNDINDFKPFKVVYKSLPTIKKADI